MKTLLKKRHLIPGQKKSRGQALVYFLGTAATLGAVFVGVYSVGQATSEKQKIVNAADAAAYSGGVTEARVLNLFAYTNRSIVANEVFIGQLISLDSWTSYVEVTTSNYETVLRGLGSIPIPVWSQILTAMAQLMKGINQVAKQVEKATDGISSSAISAYDVIMKGWLASMSPAYFPPAMALAAESSARAVVAQNAVNFGGRTDAAPVLASSNSATLRILTVTANQTQWGGLARRYVKGNGGANDDRRYFKDVLDRSLDDFTVNRPGSRIFLLGTGSIGFCPLIELGTEKRGGSVIKNFERWEAQDTLELYTATGLKCGRSYLPIGWGRATAASSGTRGDILNTPGGAGGNAYRATHQVSGWSGIKEVFDVRRDSSGVPTQTSLTYSVVVSKSAANIPTNEKARFAHKDTGSSAGSPDMQAKFDRGEVASIAAAQVFFERPFRAADFTGARFFRSDGANEFASLYNPYWQVRLTKLTDTQRVAYYAAMGANVGLPFLTQ